MSCEFRCKVGNVYDRHFADLSNASCQTQVRDFDAPKVATEEIASLNVPVDNSKRMQMAESSSGVSSEPQCCHHANRGAPRERFDTAVPEIFHSDDVRVALHLRAVHLGDVRISRDVHEGSFVDQLVVCDAGIRNYLGCAISADGVVEFKVNITELA